MATETAYPERRFYGHGKLMLTGEYLVLDGAQALAVPTRLGQHLTVVATDAVDVLQWTSLDVEGQVWVEEAFTRTGLAQAVPPAIDQSPRARIGRLLSKAIATHPQLWPRRTGLQLTTRLEFARDWGLGSSATLSYLIAAWAGCDAYALNQSEFGGSGYDVACAGASGALQYQLVGGEPQVKLVNWYPPYLDKLSLVHLGRKQDSRAGILAYRQAANGELTRYVSELDALTQSVLSADTLETLADALRQHEALVGYVTRQTPLSRERFADFPGVIKSLGAWGGDFALVVPEEGGVDVADYFEKHGLTTVVPATDLLLLPKTALPIAAPEAGDWPVFLYGPLAEPRMDNEWLSSRPHVAADLPDYAPAGERIVPAPGRLVAGTLTYLSPDEVRAFDLHPGGGGLARTQVEVQVRGVGVGAQVWV